MAWNDLQPGTQQSIIGGSGSVAGSLIGGAFALGGAALQHKYNKEMAAIQNQYNIDMWNMQNEYNSPTAQMSRLREAGLNPLLMYDKGTTGNSSVAPQQVAPNAPDMQGAMKDAAASLNPERVIDFALSVRKGAAEAKFAEEQARKAGAEADLKESEAQALGMTPDDSRGYFFNPTTQQIEQYQPVLVQRWKDNPYRRQVNVFQSSLNNAFRMRGEYMKNLLKTDDYLYHRPQRRRLWELQEDWYTYNEILKGINTGAHLLSGVTNLFNFIGKVKNWFPTSTRPLKTSQTTTGHNSKGAWSSTTVFNY